LGFTPYNNSNPSGYITSAALSPYLTTATAASTYLPLAGGTITGQLNVNNSGSATAVMRLWSAGSTIWNVGVGDSSGTNFNISADFGSLLINKSSGNVTTPGQFYAGTSNLVLHAGNYNSYSPTLTGGGASGTWAINITGTAATATSAPNYLPLAGGTLSGVTNLYAGSMGNSPAFCFGSETGPSKKAIYLDTYWLIIQGHQNEGIKLRTTDASGVTTDRLVVTTAGATINGSQVLHAGNVSSYAHTISTDPSTSGPGALAIGNNGSYSYVQSHAGQPLNLNPVGNAVNITGNTAIHAGNFSSYALPLSGGTVSGQGLFRRNQTAGDYTTAALWTESYGNTTTGIAFHISGVAGRFLEMRNNSSELFWQSAIILNSGNYSSYALPLSGGTLSGAITAPVGIFTNNGSSRVLYLRGSGNIIQFQDADQTDRWEIVGRNGQFYVYKGYGTSPGFKFQIDDAGSITINNGATTTVSGALTTNSNTRLGGGNGSPAGTGFSHTLAGVSTNRVVNFDGNGNGSPSVWWTNGSRALAAIDAKDPGLTFWANNGSGWQQQMEFNYGTVNINTTLTHGGNQVLHAGNINSYIPSWSTGVNGSHLVQRDGNGYIYANHVNFNTGIENPTIDNFITGNGDGWSRKSSLAHVKNSIRGIADGTWGISISGSAAQLGGVAASDYFTSAGSYPNEDMNTPVEGFWHVRDSATGKPEGYYGHRWDYDHLNNGQWVVQMYSPTGGDAGLWFRQRRNYSWEGWRKFLDSSNYSSYALPLSGGTLSGGLTVNNAVINAPQGFVSNGNPWGTSNSAFFPNGITTNNVTNWIYGYCYLGNAPSNGSGAEVQANGRFHNSVNSGTAMHVRRTGSAGTATDSYTALFEQTYGDHSWGIVAEFRAGGSGGSDRPSILFSNGYNSTTWSVGFGAADDQFRINQNHGYRNGGWGSERFRIDTGGTAYFNGNVAIHAGNYTNYTDPRYPRKDVYSSVNNGFEVYRNIGTISGSWQDDQHTLSLQNGDAGNIVLNWHRGGYTSHNMRYNGSDIYFDLAISSAGNITAFSDERLKKDWAALPPDFVERLATVKSGTYTRIDSGERQAGSSAQDWQLLLPEVVTKTGNDDTLALAYGNAALVSAVELAKEVVDLRTRVAQLESLINKLIGD
jgi:hypothetical protein